MQFRTEYEPGILKTFQRFTGVRLALVTFLLVVDLGTNHWSIAEPSVSLMIFALLDAGLLLAYLSLPRLQQFFGWTYLPLGIFWSTLGPILQLHLQLYQISSDFPQRAAALLSLQPILVLFIPLVIVAWQYTQRGVFLFSGLSFLTDFLLILIASTVIDTTYLAPLMGTAFVRTVLFMLVGNMIANLMRVQREQRQRLTEANDRLAQYAATLEQLTTSRERNRMARELHDVMAHTMSGVAVELEGVRAVLRVDSDQAEALLGQSLQAVREGLSETRRALQALRAAPLEDLGLGLAVRSLAESITSRAGLQVDLQIDNEVRDYPAEVQHCFYRVAQEALSNAASHAQAGCIQVILMREGPLLKLSINDDGSGFDKNTIDLTQKYGLLGMRERVEMINGTLTINSQTGVGTQVLLTYGETKS